MPLFEVPDDYFQGGSHITENEEPFHLPRKPPLRIIINEIVAAVHELQIAAPGESVKVNLTDAVAALLEDKVLAGTGIALTVIDKGGGDLAIEISAPGSTTDEKVKVSLTDTDTGLLVDKIVDADGNPLAIYGAGGNEKIQLPVAGTGWIYIEDVTVPGGSESDRVWQDAGNTVLQEITVSDPAIEVAVRASYPLVQVGAAAGTLTRDGSGGFYSGTVPLTIGGSGTLEARVKDADGNDGAKDTVDITVSLPPVISATNFQAGYPVGPGGLQTEVKEDDSFEIAVAADKNFDRVRVLDFGACKLEEFPVSPAASSHVVSATIDDEGDVATLRPARVQVRDAVTGAWSATKDTDELGASDGTHVVNCNNLFPSVSIDSISYPATQQALKASESATVGVTASDYDTLADSAPGAQLSISGGPATYTAQRIAGSYNVSTPNFELLATRNANGSQVTVNDVVFIAAIAPTIDVLAPAARLRSGGNDGTAAQDHIVTISSDQLLLDADMDEDTGGGTFQGSWSGTAPDASWTRVLQVHDNDAKGTYNWQNLSVTNLAGIVQTTISSGGSYVLGGFVQRTITVPAFASSVAFGAEVADFAKVQAGNFSPGGPSVKMPIGTTADTVNGYTINAVGVNPTTLVLLDQAAIAANSLGLYNLQDLEEVV